MLNAPTTVSQLVAVTAEWLVDSIDGMTSGGNISREYVGVILLPIVGNAAGARHDAYEMKEALKKFYRTCNSSYCLRKG